MQFGRFPRKTFLAATLLLAFSSANASFVEQIGTPVTPLAVMGTYAADAAIKPGLKAVIPPGWQLFHHQSVELPSGLSWEKDDTWVSVLNKFAGKQDIAVLIDWDKKQVFFRSTAMALKEQEKRQIIAQAASTPLPAFKGPEPKPAVADVTKPADKVAEKSGEKVADKAVAAIAAVNAVTPVSPSPKVVEKPTEPVTAAAPLALPKVANASIPAPSISVSVPAVPAQVVPAAAPAVTTPAPTAITAVSTPTTPQGNGVPSSVTVSTVKESAPASARVVAIEPEIQATKRSVRPPVKAAPVELKPAVAATPIKTASLAATVAVLPSAGVSLTARAPASTSSTAPAPVVPAVAAPILAVQAVVALPVPMITPAVAPVPATGAIAFNREPVSMVVAAAGAKHGYTVSWDASPVVFPGPVTLLGADMGEDMNLVLRALGGRRSAVGITVYRDSNVVVVRDVATGSAAVTFAEVPFSGRIREITTQKLNSPVFAAPAVAPVPAQTRAAVAPAYGAPEVAHVRVTPAYIAPAVVPPAIQAAPEPVRAIPEPARMDTAVATVKKMAPAQPMVEAAGRVVTLRVPSGGQLRDAIEAALEPGWTLKWEVKDDLVANSDMSASGDSLVAALNQVLPRLKLSADFYKPSKLVIVREADQALDK